MYLEDQISLLETARSLGAIEGFRPIKDGVEVEVTVKAGSKLLVRRHHTELHCPDGTTIRFNLGIRDAIDTILLRSGISVRVDSNVDPTAIVAKSEPPRVTLELPKCTCPPGWFPAAEVGELSKMAPNPALAHHAMCAMNREPKS